MFEHRSAPLLPKHLFFLRVFRHGVLAAVVVLLALAVGIVGYRAFEGLRWIDALLNASMILGGMGPVDVLHTTGGKVFASAYAIFSGVVFLAAVALLFVPILHRLLHHFHLEMDETA